MCIQTQQYDPVFIGKSRTIFEALNPQIQHSCVCSTLPLCSAQHSLAQHRTTQKWHVPVTARMVPPATAAAPILRFRAQWLCWAGCPSFTSGGCTTRTLLSDLSGEQQPRSVRAYTQMIQLPHCSKETGTLLSWVQVMLHECMQVS